MIKLFIMSPTKLMIIILLIIIFWVINFIVKEYKKSNALHSFDVAKSNMGYHVVMLNKRKKILYYAKKENPGIITEYSFTKNLNEAYTFFYPKTALSSKELYEKRYLRNNEVKDTKVKLLNTNHNLQLKESQYLITEKEYEELTNFKT